MLVGAAVLYSTNDWRIYGFSETFWKFSAYRVASIAALLALAMVLKRTKRPSLFDCSVLVIMLFSIGLNLALQSSRPPWFTAYMPLDPLFVFAIYVAVPVPLVLQSLLGTLLTAGVFAVFVLTKIPQDGSSITSLAIANGLAHAIGFQTSRELHRRRRIHFADRMRDAALRRSLEENQAQHRETQQVAKLGGWEFDVRTQRIIWSEEVFRLYDRDPKLGPPSYEEFVGMVPDAHRVKLTEAVQRALTEGVRYSIEHELTSADPARFLRGTGQPVADEHGQIVRLVGTVQDITEQMEAKQKMLAAKEAAEEAMLAKSDFLAMMSHELRTPMNGVLGMAELLRDTPLNEEQRDYLDIIQTSGQSLLYVINDILDFSKMEAGKLSIDGIDFDLRAVVRDCVQIVETGAKSKGLSMELDIENAPRRAVNGDPARVRQILINLLGNAVKFTQKGTIRLEVRLEGEASPEQQVYFSVTDTGIGIPDAVQKNLFQSFTQGDSSTTRQYGGTGLGLAISRRLTELMGGTIGVQSVPRQGSTFWVVIPFRSASESHPSKPAIGG